MILVLSGLKFNNSIKTLFLSSVVAVDFTPFCLCAGCYSNSERVNENCWDFYEDFRGPWPRDKHHLIQPKQN